MVVKKAQSNIQPLNAAGARQLAKQAQKEQYNNRVHRNRRIILGLLMVIIMTGLMVMFNQKYSLYQAAAKNLQVTQKQLTQAEAQQRDLKQQRQDLKDKSYLEKVVRDKYMYTKKGEIVFNLPKN